LNAQSAAEVELHASTCSRCTAVLGALGLTAPVVPAHDAWTLSRVFRWLAPLTAAATAIAIWVLVPNRPMTPVSSPAMQDYQLKSAPMESSAEAPKVTEETPKYDMASPNAELENQQRRNQEPQNQELRSPEPRNEASRNHERPNEGSGNRNRNSNPEAAQEQFARAAPKTLGATAGAAAPEAPPPPAAASARAAASADALAETVTMQTDTESSARLDPRIRWRIVVPAAVERSSDGGKTWLRTTLPVATAAAIRAVDANRAVVTSSDGAVFYTTDGGASWTRVQEKSTAPF